MIAPLSGLSRADLVRILTEPKNALVKQYQKLLGYDDVELIFTDEALDAVADLAIKRKTGARGIRAIVESFMTEVMYSLPSVKGHKKVVIDEKVVTGENKPEIEIKE